LRSRPLLVFALCSFLYELADAPRLTLVGQKLGAEQPGAGILLTSALIIAAQFGILGGSILVGRKGDALGFHILMAAGPALVPIQAVFTVVAGSASWLLAVQVFDGAGAGLFAAATPLWLADVTRGTGRYNLSQAVMATARALGATSSGLLTNCGGSISAMPRLFWGAGRSAPSLRCYCGSGCRRMMRGPSRRRRPPETSLIHVNARHKDERQHARHGHASDASAPYPSAAA
jgi:MFS family permease